MPFIQLSIHPSQMPVYATSGNYTLRVRGSTDAMFGGGVLFENETRLEFEAKHVSVFIQTDKYFYHRKQWGKYACLSLCVHLLSLSVCQCLYLSISVCVCVCVSLSLSFTLSLRISHLSMHRMLFTMILNQQYPCILVTCSCERVLYVTYCLSLMFTRR